MIEQIEEIFSRLQNFLCWTWLSFGGDVVQFWQYEINQIYNFYENSKNVAESNLRYFQFEWRLYYLWGAFKFCAWLLVIIKCLTY